MTEKTRISTELKVAETSTPFRTDFIMWLNEYQAIKMQNHGKSFMHG